MQQHLSKRKQLALRFFTYGVMTLAVVVISLVCILFVLGYRFSLTGQLEQRSLLQFRSFPNNAAVLIDGERTSVTTPGKKREAPGEYAVTMQLDGYRDWEKTVDLLPGSLLWLNYTRFVPDSVVTQSVRDFKNVTDTSVSPDRRWMTVYGGAGPSLTLVDIRDESQPQFSEFRLPRDILEKEGKMGTLAVAEWDFGGRYMLLRHEIEGATEYIIADRTAPGDAVNVTRKLNIDIEKARFAGTSGETLFALTKDGDVRKLNLGSETISRPLIRNVQDFTLYRSDKIAFSAERDDELVAGVYQDGDEEIIVRTFADDSSEMRVALNRYFGDYYFAVAHGNEVEVVKNPFEDGEAASKTFARFVFEPEVEWLSFSNNGRFILAQQDNTFATYDLELDLHAETVLSGEVERPLKWLDDFYLWTDAGGMLKTMEFDGTNQQDIVEVTPGFDATLSENGEQLFTFGRDTESEKYELQSSQMVIE